ncbi:hypothetical protein GY45DRAFT_234420 [Cubamyces sp. BRFM 1775]|nr:hypothetical protein GY45DRAFT_234420 [Cubamyces sp. BRFM 1775]
MYILSPSPFSRHFFSSCLVSWGPDSSSYIYQTIHISSQPIIEHTPSSNSPSSVARRPTLLYLPRSLPSFSPPAIHVRCAILHSTLDIPPPLDPPVSLFRARMHARILSFDSLSHTILSGPWACEAARARCRHVMSRRHRRYHWILRPSCRVRWTSVVAFSSCSLGWYARYRPDFDVHTRLWYIVGTREHDMYIFVRRACSVIREDMWTYAVHDHDIYHNSVGRGRGAQRRSCFLETCTTTDDNAVCGNGEPVPEY